MPHYFEFELSLLHIEPRIWRRFLLAAEDATFLDLHHAIQEADTWTDMHLWQFREAGRRGEAIAAMPEDEEMGFDGLENNGPPAEDVLLSQFFKRMGQKCIYDYDFGDGWEHEVELRQRVELPEVFYRRLTDGHRAFPPEDCGGVWGYYACLVVVRPEAAAEMDLQDISPEEIEERREWVGDWNPEEFELDKIKGWFDGESREDLAAKQQAILDKEGDEPDIAGWIEPSD